MVGAPSTGVADRRRRGGTSVANYSTRAPIQLGGPISECTSDRYLYSHLLGNVKSVRRWDQVLDVLRRVQCAVATKFGVSHTLYSIQVSPCDFCHAVSALWDDRGCCPRSRPLDVAAHVRSGAPSSSKQQLRHMWTTERQLVGLRLDFWKQQWGGYKACAVCPSTLAWLALVAELSGWSKRVWRR